MRPGGDAGKGCSELFGCISNRPPFAVSGVGHVNKGTEQEAPGVPRGCGYVFQTYLQTVSNPFLVAFLKWPAARRDGKGK